MKKIFPEIIWIVVLSGMFGIVNNILADKPLPLFPSNPAENAVADSVLFGNNKHLGKQYFEKTVTYDQITRLLDKSDVLFVDARDPEQYAEGFIGNAINIFPLMDDHEEFLVMVNELPHDKILILYCDGGTCDLSHQLAEVLFEFGYEQCFHYQGGWEEWIEKHNL